MALVHSQPASRLATLERAAALARGGFACLFSSSDEYEAALIDERRASGHYTPVRQPHLRIWAFAGCALLVVAVVLFAS